MKCSVIIPVGPGHEKYIDRCVMSVMDAQTYNDVFDKIDVKVIDDTKGTFGRSAARNAGVDDSDWFFFLDADDTMEERTFHLVRLDSPATFGAVKVAGKVLKANVYPCGWEEIKTHRARGTLSMGFFVRGDIARHQPWDERLDKGEDFDYYMRLPGFIKIREPLVNISKDPSAGGPRGYDKIDWQKECEPYIAARFDPPSDDGKTSSENETGDVRRCGGRSPTFLAVDRPLHLN